VLDEVFTTRDLADWIDALEGMSTPWTSVRTTADAAVDPQVVANHFVTTVEGPERTYPLVASPAQFDGTPTSLAEHPSTVSTPRRSCSSSAVPGRTSPSSRPGTPSPDPTGGGCQALRLTTISSSFSACSTGLGALIAYCIFFR